MTYFVNERLEALINLNALRYTRTSELPAYPLRNSYLSVDVRAGLRGALQYVARDRNCSTTQCAQQALSEPQSASSHALGACRIDWRRCRKRSALGGGLCGVDVVA